MKLFLAEHEYQVLDLLSRFRSNSAKWLALGPSAMHCLQKKGIPFDIPENYCSSKEVEEVCVAWFERLAEICHKLDESLLASDPFLKEWGVRPFLFHLWNLALLLDGLVSRALQLQKVLERFPEASVYAHVGPCRPWTNHRLEFSKKETLWGKVLALLERGDRVITLPNSPLGFQNTYNGPLSERLKDFLGKKLAPIVNSNFILLNVSSSFRYGIPLNELRKLFPEPSTGKSNVAVLGHPYDWQYVLPSLKKAGNRLFFLRDSIFHSDLTPEKVDSFTGPGRELWERFCREVNDDINILPLLKDRIYWIVEKAPAAARRIIQKMEELNSKNNFHLLITSSNTSYPTSVIKQFFRIKEIPVLSWQHGSVWYDRRITQRVDLLDMLCTSAHLTYGARAKRAYELSDRNNSCKLEAVGSASLDSLSLQKERDTASRSRVLYVVTNYYGNAWYCGFSPPFSDRLYFRAQSVIVRGLRNISKRMAGVSVTIKLHPSARDVDEAPPWLDEVKNVDNIRVVCLESTFVELLKDHDVILIDIPTTTLLQAVATPLPVFVLTSIISPPRSDLECLQKRAVCAGSAEQIVNEVEFFLKTGHYQADVENRDFLKLYGTHLDDGKSKDRTEVLVNKFLAAKVINR